MDDLARQVFAKLPLAEACLNLWAWVCSERELGKVYDTHRGSSYESLIKFPVLVYLIANALLQRSLGEAVTLQSGLPSGFGFAVGMKFSDGCNAGHDLIDGNRLRRTKLLAEQFLIDQTIKGRGTFRSGK